MGVPFLLVEELPGKPWTGWGTETQRAKVWSGLAGILAELARHPFTQAGSLCLKPSPNGGESVEVEVGALASDRFLVLTPDGPFETSIDYYAAYTEQYLALIADGQLYTAYPSMRTSCTGC